MNYSVDYFIKKFEAIPEEEWCKYERQNNKGQRCAHGHCHPKNVNPQDVMFNAVEHALCKLHLVIDGVKMGFAPINNGFNIHYQQPTPKQRILAALYDIQAQQKAVKQAQDIINAAPIKKLQISFGAKIKIK